MQTVNVLITKVIHHKTKTQQQHKCIWKKISEIVIRTFTKKATFLHISNFTCNTVNLTLSA